MEGYAETVKSKIRRNFSYRQRRGGSYSPRTVKSRILLDLFAATLACLLALECSSTVKAAADPKVNRPLKNWIGRSFHGG